MKDISFKVKLVICIIAMSIIPLAINSIYSIHTSKAALQSSAMEKLVSAREARNNSITRYLDTIGSQISVLSHDKMIIDATVSFISAFNKLPDAVGDAKFKLEDYYKNQFGEEYKNKTGNPSPLDQMINSLTPQSVMIQHAFISNNSNPLGSKHLLDESPILYDYSNIHKVYHPKIREFLEVFSLYDIFIVDISTGNIVYTVFKELDFSTNILTGPFSETNLAKVVRQAIEIGDQKAFSIVDFERYAPSYESPASFIASPIWDGNKKIGILVFQMPLETINEIMNERDGLGDSGETFLVGKDKRLRSDTFNNKDYNIYNSFNKNKLIENENLEKALQGNTGAVITKNYNGDEVLSAFTKVKYKNLTWAIFAEQLTTEAFKTANAQQRNMLVFILFSIIIVIAVSLIITTRLSGQIESVVDQFSNSAHDVQNSSQKMDLISNKLYRSVQTQISSITQSAAAMDEISAMLKNNSTSSQNASVLSDDTKSSALKGKDTVDKMVNEVKSIAVSYDDIQESIEKNNQDINRIIEVIEEIAKKTEVINEIVFQTKLLSFNASVEAARAGEAGKGFSVVAEEIANLAAMSGKASQDISLMLTKSKDQVRDIAITTKLHVDKIVIEGRGKIVNGNAVALECMEELDNIINCVNRLDGSIQEINSAIHEQSSGVDEVNSAMKHLENATHETTDMSEKSKEASLDLRNQSQELRNSVQVLRKILGAKKRIREGEA
jgi:methyl-accepting chemotaxis protein